MYEMFCYDDIINVEGISNLTKFVEWLRIYFVYVFFGKREVCGEKFDKIRQRLCEFGSKIEELEPTKLETVHGDGTHSSTRIFFQKIDRIREMFVRIWIQNRGVRADETRNR